MEGKRGILSHFGTVIRVILLIIFVAIITFFVVKFIRDRQASRRTQQSTNQVAQSDVESKDAGKNERGQVSDSNKQEDDEAKQAIPSGIADGEDDRESAVPGVGSTEVPAAGMGANILIITAFLSLATYAAARKIQANHLA